MALNRRGEGEVETTISWVVAFAIIFFIMLLFTGMTITLAKTKEIKKVDVASQIGFSGGDVVSANILESILSSQVSYDNQMKSIGDMIGLWRDLDSKKSEIEEIIKDKVKNILELVKKSDRDYLFVVSYSEQIAGATTKIDRGQLVKPQEQFREFKILISSKLFITPADEANAIESINPFLVYSSLNKESKVRLVI